MESRNVEMRLISYKKQKLKNFIIAADIVNSKRPTLVEVFGEVRTLEVDLTSDGEKCEKLEFTLSSLFDNKSKRIKIDNKTRIKSEFNVRAKQLQGKHPAGL